MPEVAGENGCKAFKFGGGDVEMVPGDDIHEQFGNEVAPYSGRVSRKERLGLGGDELYFAGIKAGLILFVRGIRFLLDPRNGLSNVTLASAAFSLSGRGLAQMQHPHEPPREI